MRSLIIFRVLVIDFSSFFRLRTNFSVPGTSRGWDSLDAASSSWWKAENFGLFSHNSPDSLAGVRLPVGSAFASECVIQLYLTLVKGGSGRSVGWSVGGWVVGWVAMGRSRECG